MDRMDALGRCLQCGVRVENTGGYCPNCQDNIMHSDAGGDYVDIVFDGPPSHESGRFVEVENARRESIRYGEWVERDDGYWCLRIPSESAAQKEEKS